MTYDDLIAHYKTESDAGKVIGKGRQWVRSWKKAPKGIPLKYQLDFEVDSGGALKADVSDEIRRALAERRKPTGAVASVDGAACP
jgi:hypothetical protein